MTRRWRVKGAARRTGENAVPRIVGEGQSACEIGEVARVEGPGDFGDSANLRRRLWFRADEGLAGAGYKMTWMETEPETEPEPEVAVAVTVPTATASKSPWLLMIARREFETLQVTLVVMFCVEPSL